MSSHRIGNDECLKLNNSMSCKVTSSCEAVSDRACSHSAGLPPTQPMRLIPEARKTRSRYPQDSSPTHCKGHEARMMHHRDVEGKQTP